MAKAQSKGGKKGGTVRNHNKSSGSASIPQSSGYGQHPAPRHNKSALL